MNEDARTHVGKRPARIAEGLLERFSAMAPFTEYELQEALGGEADIAFENVCLLVIDVYQVVFEPGRMSCGQAAHDAAPTLRRVLEAARRARVQVVHTTGEARREARPLEATQMVTDVRSVGQLRQDYAPFEGFEPLDGEAVIYKSAASAFFETRLRSFLQASGVRSLVVIGESTSGCVRATVVDAYSAGFKVYLPFDAVFDRSETAHLVNLHDMGLKYATIVDAEAVMESWSVD